MIKLFNTSDFYSCEKIKEKVEYYKEKYNFDGIELIKFSDSDNLEIKDYVKGYHLRFFPMWIDLYLEKMDILEKEIDSIENYIYLCGGKTKNEMFKFYERELELAHKLQVEYVVLHVCNIRLSETYTYNFEYTDKEILSYVSEIINKIMKPKYKFKLLLENLWWPGLKLTSKSEVEFLLKNIEYKNLGFMLDTGHLLNTNLNLQNSNQAIEYIKKSIADLGNYKKYINGMHLNYSLSGEYVRNVIKNEGEKEQIYKHIGKIDYHDPFEHSEIKEIIEGLPIDYLIYELIGKDDKEFEEKVRRQEEVFRKV
ncbi:MAG: TIM barrel protein [Cetobacterium sp.]|uniref:TIM barrel protein n=1 Tax=Cetobacterium sp. TaxID=2071632 RepID=UPI002FCBBE26